MKQDMIPDLPNWLDILGLISLVTIAVIEIFSTSVRQNVKNQKELIETLNTEMKLLKEQHHNNEKLISELKGQLDVVKEIPLKSINDNQVKMLKGLKDISIILGKLVKE